MKNHTYKIKGMHCASCEVLIEKKLLKIENVKSVDASLSKEQVVVQYEGSRPNPEKINNIFKSENYIFSDFEEEKAEVVKNGKKASPTLVAFNIALFIIIGFLFLRSLGFEGILNVSSSSSLFAFFGLGLLAGVSSCAALVGGMVLSMSKQWSRLYDNRGSSSTTAVGTGQDTYSTFQKFQPHLMFNAGRIASYIFFGGLLGLIGSQLQISFKFTSFLVIVVSFLMIALGLQMLGVKAFRKFQFTLPKFVTRYISDENNFQGKYMPLTMGALTFFLPCGFTITAQGLALLSGNAIQGSLIMGAFALGTAPSLLFIGFSSVKLFSKSHLAVKFSKVAGFLVLFFALFNISTQMNVLGFVGFSSFLKGSEQNIVNEKDLPAIINGKQVIEMEASARGYSPNYFKIKAGVPVRWEIKDIGTSGCTNAVIASGLFSGSVPLTKGQTAIKEFTPTKAGKYRFSCWIGMVTGTIEVVN